jgi:hypothetical protein
LAPNAAFAERIPFTIQNVTQSVSVSTPGLEQYFQIASILPPRNDGKFYTGQLTYSADVPVEATFLQPRNETIQAQGSPISVPGLNATISHTNFLEPRLFDSTPFTSSSVSLLYRNPRNFTVSYSVVGELVDPEPLPK